MPVRSPDAGVGYNKDQWRSSFEGRLALLRSHLSERVLETMSLSAWTKHGTKGEDPVRCAREWSATLDKPPA